MTVRTNSSRDQNFEPTLVAVDSTDSTKTVAVEADPTTGAMLVSATINATVTTSAGLYTGQITVSTTQVQVSSSSHSLTNGIILKALSTNGASIYVGLTGVTTSTGDILEPGDVRGYAVNNTNLLYIISAASTTDKISYSAN